MPRPRPSDRPRPPDGTPPPMFRGSLILLGLLAISVFTLWTLGRSVGGEALRYDELKQYLREDRVESVQLGEKEIHGLFKEGRVPGARSGKGKEAAGDANRAFVVYRVGDDKLIEELEQRGVEYSGEKPSDGIPMFSLVLYLGLALLLLMMLGGGMGRAGRGPAGVLAFGKSKGKVFQEDDVDVSFADVAGVPEAKLELREIIDFLERPEKYKGLGAKIPKGVLLVGPPGTGKTLLARAVAGEAGVPFISINGSEFVEMFVGVGASRVRDLFEQASRAAPCIVFIDELDAIGRARSGVSVGGGSNEEREQTLNQLLVELDGFEPHKAVIIMSATNRPEILDPALLRPGRFDRQVLVDRPDRNGREEILKVHVRGVPLAKDLDLGHIAAQTPGFAGADLHNLVNEAALRAARRGASEVSAEDFSKAIDRVVAGLERRSRIISDEERGRIAVHEIGHAITARCAGSQTVQKISIIPHGLSALGYTRKSPSQERQLMTRSMLHGELVSLLGGRTAEVLVYGEPSTGAANDLSQATELARAMVMDYGMSEAVGPVSVGGSSPSPWLGPDALARSRVGGGLADRVDQEVRSVIEAAEAEARRMLTANRALLDTMAERLVREEQLEGEALQALLAEVQACQPAGTAPGGSA